MNTPEELPAEPHIHHRLPDDPGTDDILWFTKRQNTFEQKVIKKQVAYKRSRWPKLPDGQSSKHPNHTYPHILPSTERLAFFDGFADEVLKYMNINHIAIHTEALNLKSSQVACLNFLFPFRLNYQFAAKVLRNLFPNMTAVTGIEFEYTGQDEKKRKDQPCTAWLGEPHSGKRGQNRTSIDAAIFWTDDTEKAHISLIEWKYTEKNFGLCSAFNDATAQVEADCLALNVLDENPEANCLLAGEGSHYGRHYWDHMEESGIRLARLAKVQGCPFRGPFYQLMRQFLVAQFLRDQPTKEEVEVIAIEFAENQALKELPKELEPLRQKKEDTVIGAWNSVIEGVPKLGRITAEKLLAAYDATPATDPTWRQYIRDRYGM